LVQLPAERHGMGVATCGRGLVVAVAVAFVPLLGIWIVLFEAVGKSGWYSLLALSVENDSHSIRFIQDSGVFTVNVLPRGALETAGTLGRRWAKVPDKLDRVGWDAGPNGCAVLHEALGYLECAIDAALPAGDSTLFLARITGARVLREGPPLTMADTPFKHAG